jgi:hypothetical protein
MQKVRVHTTVEVDGKTYQPGDFADVSDEAMEFLVKSRAASAIAMRSAATSSSASPDVADPVPAAQDADERTTTPLTGAQAVAAQAESVANSRYIGFRSKGNTKRT